MTTREESKEDAVRKKWGKLIAKGWRRTEEDLTKKELRLLILNRYSNCTQLLTNSSASNKHFILIKLFLLKFKSINLAF